MLNLKVFDTAYINMPNTPYHAKHVEVLSRFDLGSKVVVSFIDDMVNGEKAIYIDQIYIVKGKGQVDEV